MPPACTLPATERAPRLAEFDGVLAAAVRAERVAPDLLRLAFPASPRLAATVAALAVTETGCCSFFTFTLTVAPGELTLDVAVAASRTEVLDALTARVPA